MGADLYMELGTLKPALSALFKLEKRVRAMHKEPHSGYTPDYIAGYNGAIDEIADLIKAYNKQIGDLGFRQVPYVIE